MIPSILLRLKSYFGKLKSYIIISKEMKFENILSDLEAKKYSPVYFLMGEESLFIDKISDYIGKNVLDEAEKDFNQSIIYGKESSIESVLSKAKQFPLMGDKVVVIVKEAQHLKKIEQLQSYIENPQQSTILVICYKNKVLHKRKSFAKAVAKKAVLFESKKLYDNQIPEWIGNFVSSKNYQIQYKASYLLGEYLGNDLNKITNELNKLMIIVPENSEISSDIIERNIGISKDFNNFELTNALGQNDILKSNRIATYFANNPKSNPLVVTLVVLFNFFQKVMLYHVLSDKSQRNVATELKINPYFVKDYQLAAKHYGKRKCMTIISLLREYDMKCKGVDNATTPDGELLKELLYKILH